MIFARAAVIAIASSAALAMVLASSLAAAEGTDSDNDGVPDDIEDATQRTVAVNVLGDQFSVSSRLGTAPVEDRFDLAYRAGTFVVWYNQRGGSPSMYRLELLSLVAWNDANGNGRIDPGELVGTTPLASTAFAGSPVVNSTRIDPADGGRIYGFAMRSHDGNATLSVTMAERFTRVDNVILTPMEARVDIAMTSAAVPSGAKLGIQFRMSASARPYLMEHSWDEDHGFAADERAVNVTEHAGDRSATSFFSWSNTAKVGGAATPVVLVNGIAEYNPYEMTLIYGPGPTPTGTEVLQRTTLGVHSAVYEIIRASVPPVRADPLLYAGTIAAVSVLVALSIVLANRRRRNREDSERKP
jgi:hypothetical protein